MNPCFGFGSRAGIAKEAKDVEALLCPRDCSMKKLVAKKVGLRKNAGSDPLSEFVAASRARIRLF